MCCSPTNIGTGFFAYLGVFAAALVAGVISQVPGGIGVFESVMLRRISPI
jgi:uncharacterized membrane protein YbhN (UPF0104 family)